MLIIPHENDVIQDPSLLFQVVIGVIELRNRVVKAQNDTVPVRLDGQLPQKLQDMGHSLGGNGFNVDIQPVKPQRLSLGHESVDHMLPGGRMRKDLKRADLTAEVVQKSPDLQPAGMGLIHILLCRSVRADVPLIVHERKPLGRNDIEARREGIGIDLRQGLYGVINIPHKIHRAPQGEEADGIFHKGTGNVHLRGSRYGSFLNKAREAVDGGDLVPVFLLAFQSEIITCGDVCQDIRLDVRLHPETGTFYRLNHVQARKLILDRDPGGIPADRDIQIRAAPDQVRVQINRVT